MIEVPSELIEAYGEAWHRADRAGAQENGARRRAGITAVLESLEPEQLMELLHDCGVPATEYAAYLGARRAEESK